DPKPARITEVKNAVAIGDELEVIEIDGAVAGEIALYHPSNGGTLIVGDALINFEPYGFTLLPRKYCLNEKRMRSSLRQLLRRPAERMLSPTARQSLHGQLCVCGNCWKAIHRSSCEFGRSTSSERNTIGQCPGALSSIDSIFAHDFRVAVCAWCIGCGSERSALSANITSGPGMHGFRAHRGNDFQSLRRLVARSTQPAHGCKAFASLKIRRRRIARCQFGRFLGVSRRDQLVDVCALAGCARDRVLLFADQALHR